jgi:hypothetical protein
VYRPDIMNRRLPNSAPTSSNKHALIAFRPKISGKLPVVLVLLLLLSLLGFSYYLAPNNYQSLYPANNVVSRPLQDIPPSSHYISLQVQSQSFDPATGKITFTTYLFASLPPNYTEIYYRISSQWGNFSHLYDLPRPAGQGYGSVAYLQSNASQTGPFVDYTSGIPQRFPYDEYFLLWEVTTGQYNNQTFPSNYIPDVGFQPPTGWQAVVTESSTHVGSEYIAQIRIGMFRSSVNSFEYFVPLIAMYSVLGATLFVPRSSRLQDNRSSLQLKSTIYLAIIAASFTLINSFVPPSVAQNSFAFLQATYLSLLVGTILILSLSIMDAFLSSRFQWRVSPWEYLMLIGASMVPMLFQLAYSYLTFLPSSQYVVGLKSLNSIPLILPYLDFRMPLWFALFFAVVWVKFFHAYHFSELPFLVSGIGVLVVYLTSRVPGVDPGLLAVAILYATLGILMLASRLVSSKMVRKRFL